MALWRKRKFGEEGIDYEMYEGVISELLDSFDGKEIDFSKPLTVGFELSVDSSGCLRVDGYGIIERASGGKAVEARPLVEVIDFEKDLLVVVDTADLPEKDVDVKVYDREMLISNHNSKKFLKKVSFPCSVKQDSMRTSLNNGVLELRLAKNEQEKKLVKSK